jgi:hypothetical protein
MFRIYIVIICINKLHIDIDAYKYTYANIWICVSIHKCNNIWIISISTFLGFFLLKLYYINMDFNQIHFRDSILF